MRSFWESTSPSSSGDETNDVAPTQLLSMAIKKRRALYESKDRDFRKELLHTGMIQTLCKFLGEGRACRKSSNKRASRKRKPNHSSQAGSGDCSLPKKYAISNADLEQQPMETDPMLNSTDEDQDAVVPVIKRSKYEQVFVPQSENEEKKESEPTEQEKEIIKEYVFEDFMSSFVSFYAAPNEYYTNGEEVEPTKDLYWSALTSDDVDMEALELELDHPPNPPPDSFELLGLLCS